VIYDPDDQGDFRANDDSDDQEEDDVGDQEEDDVGDRGLELCKELLEDRQIKNSVTVKVRNIISCSKRCADNEHLLYKELSENNVSFTDACSCKKLFIIFLEISNNMLLARLLGAEVHKGRTGSAVALDDFKRIW
jgi:hypothetical protein